MNTPINILVVQDSDDDTKLMLRALRRGGFHARHERVDGAAAMQTALARGGWDAVIADYRVPRFSGLDALRLFKAASLDVPFILVSGAIGERVAVEAMKAGASDYVSKQNLARLAPALARELEAAALRTTHRQTQRELSESDARFRSLTSMSSDFYWETDAEHRFTLRGDGSKPSAIAEFLTAAWIGKRRWELPCISPDEAGWQAHRALLDARQPFRQFELSRLGADGAARHISISGDPAFNAAGAFKGYRGVGSDVTERKQAEQSLRAAEQQFRSLVEQSIAGIYIVQDRKFAYLNPRCAQIFGYASAEEMMDIDDPLSIIAEKDRGGVAEILRRRPEGEVRTMEYSFSAVRKDGSTIEVGAHGACATYRGRPAIIGLMQDISEKKRAEEEIRRYVTQLEGAFMRTVTVATALSGMRDPYTASHERRVGEIAVAIGAELGLDARRQEGLRVAGYLHDVGKIIIPSEILSRPGKLSVIEFELIKGHAQAGYDVLAPVEFPWPVAEVALQHHERLDGSGYPRGLKGDAILFEARILAVADVVEAMTSHRPYRAGLGIERALAEIERGRGTTYEPAVVEACVNLFREKAYAIPD